MNCSQRKVLYQLNGVKECKDSKSPQYKAGRLVQGTIQDYQLSVITTCWEEYHEVNSDDFNGITVLFWF